MNILSKALVMLMLLLLTNIVKAQVSFIHTDILGSPVAETDVNGKIVSLSHYQAYGNELDQKTDDVGYTGHKFDTDLGLSYMQARYYDPVIGRFYSNDPVGFTGDVDTFNRYSYVANNPYKYTDPTGKAKYKGDKSGIAISNLVARGVAAVTEEGSPLNNYADAVVEATDGALTGKKRGSSSGNRAGKKHTKGAIKEAKKQNAEKNGGVVKCETCGVETTPGTQRTRGSTVNPNEGQGDHIQAKSKGGNGATVKDQSNIDIKCAACNNKKSDN